MTPTESCGSTDEGGALPDFSEDAYGLEYLVSDDELFQELVKEDHSRWLSRVHLDVDPSIRLLYDIQSLVGHAGSGHCAFENQRYAHATIEEIVLGLDLDPEEVRGSCDDLMQRAEDVLLNALDYEGSGFALTDSEGYALGGIGEFPNITIKDPMMLLWGFYLAGAVMDNADWRLRMSSWFEEEHGFELPVHAGECYPIDIEQLSYWNSIYGDDLELTLNSLARDEWQEPDIDWFREVGIIPDSQDGEDWVQASRTVVSGYVQLSKGLFGGSDDASIIYIGRLYGQDAMIGAYMADWFDTLDKYPDRIHFGGRDEWVANRIHDAPEFQEEFGPEGRDWLREEVIFPFLLFSSTVPAEYLKREGEMKKRQIKKRKLPSSSQSRFLRWQQVKGNQKMTALRSHLDYAIFGDSPPRGLHIAFEQLEADEFYSRVDQKLLYFDDNTIFPEGHEPRFI